METVTPVVDRVGNVLEVTVAWVSQCQVYWV